jgi:tetratricopeptide (TPR) repeat protein
VDYYLEHAAGPIEERARHALALTERELARRRDVFTLDIHARALAANGRLDEAREAIERALEVGIQDAGMLFHAAEIAAAQAALDAAVGYYVESLDTNARSEVAERARAALQRLRPAALSR